MKRISLLISVIYLVCGQLSAQNSLPSFLEGTWQMENGEVYEVWEMTEDGLMKGHSYRIREGEEEITEYLEIKQLDDQVIYTATVLNQNEGRGIDFTLSRPNSLTWVFENPEHDFPKKILYQKRSDMEIYVQVSDGVERSFDYVMNKIPGEDEHETFLRKFFDSLNGSWVGIPVDSSFISHLNYTQSKNRFLIIAENTITSQSGDLFAKYEGVYLYNIVEQQIFFTTITENEIHRGISEIIGDTLFHKAYITGNSNIKSYSSAIVKKDDDTVHYFADYSNSDSFPLLKFKNPLIYRKEQ